MTAVASCALSASLLDTCQSANTEGHELMHGFALMHLVSSCKKWKQASCLLQPFDSSQVMQCVHALGDVRTQALQLQAESDCSSVGITGWGHTLSSALSASTAWAAF